MRNFMILAAVAVLLLSCLLRGRKERHERSEAEAEQARQRIAEDHRDALVERVHQANMEWLERHRGDLARDKEKNERFLRELFQGENVHGAPRVKVLESGIVTVRASCPEEAAEIVSQSKAFAWRST